LNGYLLGEAAFFGNCNVGTMLSWILLVLRALRARLPVERRGLVPSSPRLAADELP
jgi:hypothetical protein